MFDLSPAEALLMHLIDALCQNDSNSAYASKAYLAETLNISKPGIYVILRQLVAKGLIIRTDESAYGLKTTKIYVSDTWKRFKAYCQDPENYHPP